MTRGPSLRSLVADDPASAWTDGGFTVVEHDGTDLVPLGPLAVTFADDPRGGGLVAASFVGLDGSIDGLPLDVPRDPPADVDHVNRCVGVDHVVLASGDLDRTVTALEAAGFEARRSRDVPGSDRRQVFFWAGSTILELVGPVTPDPDAGPLRLWGLALTVDDLDAAALALGERLGAPKTAVQAGRRIATLRTRDLGISTAIAFMSPHPEAD